MVAVRELNRVRIYEDKSYHFLQDARIPKDAPMSEALCEQEPGVAPALREGLALSPWYDVVVAVMEYQGRMLEA